MRQLINDLSNLITSQLARLPVGHLMGWLTRQLANHLEGQSVSLSFSQIGTSISESVGQLLHCSVNEFMTFVLQFKRKASDD